MKTMTKKHIVDGWAGLSSNQSHKLFVIDTTNLPTGSQGQRNFFVFQYYYSAQSLCNLLPQAGVSGVCCSLGFLNFDIDAML